MTQRSQPIIFFGTEDFSLYSLKALVDTGFPVVAVVTKADTPRGRGNVITEPAVKTFAISKNIPVWQPTHMLDIVDDIKQYDAPVGVLVSFGKIIPSAIIDLFTPGIINVHPSLLPLYRGPSPIESAIKNRDAKTGVTLMQLAPKMDAGPIYTQVPYALDQTETKPELYDTLGQLGANLLVQKLSPIIDGTIQPIEQDDHAATYCQLLSKDDSLLDPLVITPGDAEALVRAHLGFPRTRVTIGEHTIIVKKAHAVMTKNTPLDIECQNGAFLSIDELVGPSGRTMTSDAFLRGYSL
ncbi:methionyl-tRNA formyltransferase [Microbacteriaceae bacterium]|nr:methionyl-tRNA formyltransferase [Candidatus Saccharibacteria bacterium]